MDCAALHRSMGVHISFVRSTDLDKWKPHELKAMENGGNAKAKSFFRDHGVLDMDKIESKYHTSAAQQYKNKIKDLISDAPKKKTTVSSASYYSSKDTKTETTAAADNTSKTATPPTTSPTNNGNKAKGLASKNSKFDFNDFEKEEEEEEDDTFGKSPAKPAATFAPLENPVSTTPDFSRKSVASAAKPTGKLGAKATSNSFFADFDLEDDEEKEDDEPKNSKVTREDLAPQFSRLSYTGEPVKKSQSQKDSFNDSYSSPSNTSSSGGRGGRQGSTSNIRNNDSSTDYARQKFSNAKSISSDQYFGNDKQEQNNYERETRMARFQGAQSISSADYFERDESVSVSDMSASDVARKLAWSVKSEMGSLSSVLSEGGKKMSQMANSMLNELQERYS